MNFKFKNNLLEEVIEIARTASKSIMAIYEKDFAIELKNDGSQSSIWSIDPSIW